MTNLLAALAFSVLSVSTAFASGPMTPAAESPQAPLQNDCRWDPQGSSICRGRNFCFMSPNHPKCRLYCSYYPYDRVCNRW